MCCVRVSVLKIHGLTEDTKPFMTEKRSITQPFAARMASCCTACCHWWWTNGETDTQTQTQPTVASQRLAEETAVADKATKPETVVPVAVVPVAQVLVVEQDDDHEWDDTMY